MPRLDRLSGERLVVIPGNPPNLLELPSGCRFRDRCDRATEACLERPPVWEDGAGRMSRCVLPMQGGTVRATEPADASPDPGGEGAP